jgi:hypothetical protein
MYDFPGRKSRETELALSLQRLFYRSQKFHGRMLGIVCKMVNATAPASCTRPVPSGGKEKAMDCYSCGAALRAGQCSCDACELHFPLPVPGPEGQKVPFIAQYPSRPIISDRVFAPLVFRIVTWVVITCLIVLKLSSLTMATANPDPRAGQAAIQVQAADAQPSQLPSIRP